MRRRWMLLWAAPALTGPACAGDDDVDSAARARDALTSYCGVLCQRASGCLGGPLDPCLDLCRGDPLTPPLNADVWISMTDCIRAVSCEDIQTDAFFEGCFQQALDDLEPSRTCVDFCAADSAASFECGGGYSVEVCVTDGTCGWEDGVLEDARACHDITDCEARDGCFAEVFQAQ